MKKIPRLVLAGGGHAHLSVLRALTTQQWNTALTLVTPEPHQSYSGMLPGWLAGHYSLDDCRIDLRPLAKAAGVQVLFGKIVGMDAAQRMLMLSDGSQLDYDYLSLDIGSESDLSWLEAAGKHLLPIKPLGNFVQRWPAILSAAAERKNYRIVVVGGGAAGVELVLAAQYACAKRGSTTQVALVASENGILPGHSNGVKKRATELLHQRGIALYQAQAVGAAEGVMLSDGRLLRADCLIAATGARAPAWLRASGLELDEHGYILVDAAHRSLSHPDVFAAGDVCSRSDIKLARSGVHAVFVGPVLAHNLYASMNGGELIHYRPRKRNLYLLATGPKHAIASWGVFSAQGYWVWRWKNWIDRRFMKKHRG